MEAGLKQRIVGAAVLVILAVIFIPMLLDTSVEDKQSMGKTNIPPQPANMPTPPTEDFNSRIIPLEQPPGPPGTSGTADTQKTPPVEEGIPPATSATPPQEPREPVVENKNETGGVGVTAWVVQLGSFSSPENAEALNQKLRKAGFKAFVEPLKQDTGTIYRVRIGPDLKRSDADTINDRLKKELQLEGIVVHYP